MNRCVPLPMIGSLLLLLGCGGGDDPAGPSAGDDPVAVATTLTVSPTTLSFSSLGATEPLTATVLDQTVAVMRARQLPGGVTR